MHIASSDKRVALYNLDTIISVGYRVKSQQGTRFRIWATQTLREHLLRRYTLTDARAAIRVLRESLATRNESMDLRRRHSKSRSTHSLDERMSDRLFPEHKDDRGAESRGSKRITVSRSNCRHVS